MTVESTQAVSVPTGRVSIAAIVSLAGAIVLLVLHMSVRLFVVISAQWNTSVDWGFIIGLLGLLSLVPIVSGIVFGHVGVSNTKNGKKRGRIAAVAGVAIGYVLFVLYFNRLIVVLLAMAFGGGDFGRFAQYFMYYI